MTNKHIKEIGNDTEIDRLVNKYMTDEQLLEHYVEVGDDKICLPSRYRDYAEKLKKFEVRDDDVFVVGHPKTGTTWCQEMVWLIGNNLDYERAKSEFIMMRSPILEASVYKDPLDSSFNIIKNMDPLMLFQYIPSPRFFKSHLPWSLLPEQIQNGAKKPKIIVTVRKPHDVCVSYYHHLKKYGLLLTLDDFAKVFLAGRALGGPFDKSVLSYWEEKDRSNILIVYYHDMKSDLKSTIKKVADFLDKTLTEEDIDQLADFLKFENMKNNPSSNSLGLLRKGEVGSHKKEMSEELIEKFDEWEREKFKGFKISFE